MRNTLLLSLYDLFFRLSSPYPNERREKVLGSGGMLQRYKFFIEHGEYKEKCAYAIKAADLFLANDYEEVKKLFLSCLEEYRKVEGDSFGR